MLALRTDNDAPVSGGQSPAQGNTQNRLIQRIIGRVIAMLPREQQVVVRADPSEGQQELSHAIGECCLWIAARDVLALVDPVAIVIETDADHRKGAQRRRRLGFKTPARRAGERGKASGVVRYHAVEMAVC